LQPAITALTASLTIVAAPQRGGIGPSEMEGSRSVEASICATRASVGGTIGSPSVQSSRANRSKIASGSSSTVMRSATAAAADPPEPAAPRDPVTRFAPAPVSVALSTIAAMTGSARRRMSGCCTLTIGCGMYTAGRSGWPRLVVTIP